MLDQILTQVLPQAKTIKTIFLKITQISSDKPVLRKNWRIEEPDLTHF
jgi:hypothetical protein